MMRFFTPEVSVSAFPATVNGDAKPSETGGDHYSSTMGRPKSALGVPGLRRRGYFGGRAFAEALGIAVLGWSKSAAIGFLSASALIFGGFDLGEPSTSMPSRASRASGLAAGLAGGVFLAGVADAAVSLF